MLGTCLLILICGDTLRWYDPATVGYNAIAGPSASRMYWAISFSIDSSLSGRTIHSGRVHIYQELVYPTEVKLCRGSEVAPGAVLQVDSFQSTGYGFYEVFYSDSIVLSEGDYIWLWCTQGWVMGEFPATTDSGPAKPCGDWISEDGVQWKHLSDYPGYDYNWVMELILTPLDVEEGPAKPEEKLILLPAPGGFWITGYEGEAWIYGPAGRLVLKREIKDKTLISPLRPGVYFVMAGKERARVAVR